MPAKIIFSNEQSQDIINQYLSNVSLSTISSNYNVSDETITGFLKNNNIPLRSKSQIYKIRSINNFNKSINQKFGYLTVLFYDALANSVNSYRKDYVICQCDCGEYTSVALCNLRNGKVKSCGCSIYNKQIIDLKWSSLKLICGSYKIDFQLHIAAKLFIANCWYCNQIPCMKTNYFDKSKYCHIKTAQSELTKTRYQNYFNSNYDNASFLRNGLDRVDPSIKSHSLGNLVPCCYPCNIAKLNMPLVDFLSQSISRYNHILNLPPQNIDSYINSFIQKTNDFLLYQLSPSFSSYDEAVNLLLNNSSQLVHSPQINNNIS